MSTETESVSESTPSESVSGSASEAASTTTETTSSNSEYGVTDPGYETLEPVEDDLAALRAENTKQPPENSGDASEPEAEAEAEVDGGTEGAVETPPAESVDSPDEISDELLDRAVAVGYELDDIRGFQDAKAFDAEISRVERLQSRLKGKTAPAGADADPEPPPESEEPDWDQLIEDGHDPEMIALQKENRERAVAAERTVRELQKAEQVRAELAQAERFDAALNALGSEYEPILGQGHRAELAKSSPVVAENRQKVFTKMAILRSGYEMAGERVPPESELIQEAVQASFYKQSQEIARNSLKKQIKNAGSQALSRPRSGGQTELHGPDRALEIERDFWKSHST